MTEWVAEPLGFIRPPSDRASMMPVAEHGCRLSNAMVTGFHVTNVPARAVSAPEALTICVQNTTAFAFKRTRPFDASFIRLFASHARSVQTAYDTLAGILIRGATAPVLPIQGESFFETCVVTSVADHEQGAFEARVRELEKLTSQDNWDLEGGHAIAPDLWSRTRRFYATAKDRVEEWLEPFVSPSGDGTVHLTWLRDGGRVNLEICDGEWHIAVKRGPGAGYKKSKVSELQALAQLRDFLG